MPAYQKDSPDWFVPLMKRALNAQYAAAGMPVPFPEPAPSPKSAAGQVKVAARAQRPRRSAAKPHRTR